MQVATGRATRPNRHDQRKFFSPPPGDGPDHRGTEGVVE